MAAIRPVRAPDREGTRLRLRRWVISSDGLAEDREGFSCSMGAGVTAAFARGAVLALDFHLQCRIGRDALTRLRATPVRVTGHGDHLNVTRRAR